MRQQVGARSDFLWQTEEVHEDIIKSAIGRVTRTESSRSIEKLFLYTHEKNIEDELRCSPGRSSLSVRFNLTGDLESQIENEEADTTREGENP